MKLIFMVVLDMQEKAISGNARTLAFLLKK